MTRGTEMGNGSGTTAVRQRGRDVRRAEKEGDEAPIIKSAARVKAHGEVYTPAWLVEQMLGHPGIDESLHDPHATFLEPAAGNGNFLVAILAHKLAAGEETWWPQGGGNESVSGAGRAAKRAYEDMCLWALASIYGIELLDDNVAEAQERMLDVFVNHMESSLGRRVKRNRALVRSARAIIRANIIQGNMLTMKRADGTDIVLYAWEPCDGRIGGMRRTAFTLASVAGKEPLAVPDGAKRYADGTIRSAWMEREV